MQTESLQVKPSGSLPAYLNSLFINYLIFEMTGNQTVDEAAKRMGIAPHAILRPVLLADDLGQVMAILPSDYFLDFNLFCKKLDRDLVPLTKEEEQNFIYKNGFQCLYPLPEAFAVQGIVEDSVLAHELIYLHDAEGHAMIGMKQEEFAKFLQHSTHISFAIPASDLSRSHLPEQKIADLIKQLTPTRIKQRVDETFELPAIPVVAAKILKLRFDPKATAQQLAQIIQTDPSLAAQLMNWSRSAYYGYKGGIHSLEDAIVKVLGFDLVMELSLGIALSRSMKVPLEGPIGLKNYWPFAVFSAELVEKMAMKMNSGQKPQRGLAYLAGLLHNFGHLILGQLFPPHFELLNRYIAVNPQVNILEIEHYVLGVGHDQIGAWLLERWNLPKEIIAAANFHHQEQFASNYAIYPTLVLIADRLLKKYDLGDADTTEIPQAILEKVSLTRLQINETLANIWSKQNEIKSMADELLALTAR